MYIQGIFKCYFITIVILTQTIKNCVTFTRIQQKLLLQRVGVHGASVHLQQDHRVHVTGRVSATVQRHEVLRLEVQRLVLVSPQPVVYTDVVHGQ
jgi:hypothetical protein